MEAVSLFVVLGCTAAVVLLGWAYFQRYQLVRPPLGVINLWDVGLMIGASVVVPYLDQIVPLWIVTGLLAVALLGMLYAGGEPVLSQRWMLWIVVLSLMGADVVIARVAGTANASYWIVNDTVLLLAVVALTNLWAQSGMKARDLALLAGALAIYDLVATWWLPVTTDLTNRLAGGPFYPLVGWGAGHDRLEIGLGDLLLATVFPLVMRKAFGHAAGKVALASILCPLAVLFAFVELAGTQVTLPAMTILGPLMVVEYYYWMRHTGGERSTWRFRQPDWHVQACPPR